MKRFLKKANQRISLGGAAGLLMVAALSGQLLGLLRTKMVNANFPIFGPDSTDAYFAAFKIPDFFFFTLAAGALGVAFMPFLADRLERGDRQGMWDLTSSLMNLLAVVMAAVGVVILLFAEPLLQYVVAPNLSPEQMHNAATIMRLIAFNPLLFTLSGILTSVQQTMGRFFFYAVAPIFYNASIIVSIFIFRDTLGLIGLGVGALLGAVLQLGIVILGMQGAGFKYRPVIAWRTKDFRGVLQQLPPRSLDQGVDSLNSIAETNFARRLGEGNITFYENAYILHTAPILLIGTTIATAAFPRLTERLAQNRSDLFRKEFLEILQVMIWIAMPVVVVVYFARGYLARLIYAQGAPTIALILGFLTGAVFFRIIYALISRWYYAQKDNYTPLFVSVFAIALNIYLAYVLSRPTAYGVTGLAMAQSIVGATEVGILVSIMLIRDNKLFNMKFWNGIVRILSVTGFSVLAAFIMISLLPLNVADRGVFTLGFKFGAITAVTFLVHLGISMVFGMDEPKPVIQKFRQVALKPIGIKW